MARFVVVDERSMVRTALRGVLEGGGFTVIGEAEGGDGAVDLIANRKPDAVVIGLVAPTIRGLELISRIVSFSPSSKIIVYCSADSIGEIKGAIRFGASAVVKKDQGVDDFCEVVRSVLSGHKIFPVIELEETLGAAIPTTIELLGRLTRKELSIFRCLVEGKTVRQIAEEKYLSVSAVYAYRTKLLEKLELENVSDIQQYAEGSSC
ncbi:response regulator transcription factor [Pseudomonas delhiensis]|uniref:response regulator transcription factor n=1 Tax=Pseudomonas delhiensis TaxID=366289 RepID=UPI000B76D267|nr:response regulator transcription factor [Pseudomonas delhiensis]